MVQKKISSTLIVLCLNRIKVVTKIGILIFFGLISCTSVDSTSQKAPFILPLKKDAVVLKDSFPSQNLLIIIDSIGFRSMRQKPFDYSATALVNIKDYIPHIVIDLKYSGTNNFVGIDLYGPFEEALLQKEVCEKLKKAQAILQSKYPMYSLIVFDAFRPLRVQKFLWESLKVPVKSKTKFLSNPKNGSLHNYGAAVDVSLCDHNGQLLDMGTPYDYMGPLAYPRLQKQFYDQGKLNAVQIANRNLLFQIMKEAGFSGITTEWWHFNSCSRAFAKAHYQMYD